MSPKRRSHLRDERSLVCLVDVDHLPAHATVEHDVLAGDEARARRQEKRNQLRDVLNLSHAPDRVLSVVLCAQRRGTHFGNIVACVDPTGTDAVHSDIWTPADRKRVCEGNDATLRRRVSFTVRLGLKRACRRNIDDRSAGCP